MIFQRRLIQASLYLMSISLLFILLAVRMALLNVFSDSEVPYSVILTKWIPIAFGIVAVLPYIIMLIMNHITKGTMKLPVNLVKVTNEKKEVTYLFLSFIIPFLFVDCTDIIQIVELIIALIILGILSIGTDVYYKNPALLLFGYKVYNVESANKTISGIVISRKEVIVGDFVEYLPIDDGVYLIRKKEKADA